MNSLRRTRWMMAVLLLLLVVITLWSYSAMRSSQEAAEKAVGDTVLCQRMAERITDLQRKPSLAGSQELAMTELARLIEQAAESSQISASSLVRITPEAARRLGDSVYKEKPTQVLLRQVKLDQILRFLHRLTSSDSGLETRHIRLSAPREQEQGDTWVLEATLSYLIYAPASPQGESSLQKSGEL